ncbi:hypothetical protein I9W82_001059 [Candida metapsilosis]|uniref:Uncharacterized protein n=1 Tax=Candida metapsilosis TaxID=273372 RepID=A0A8H7ZLK3_9ASCO|nr:hypothetical protein I9W82_001059 [Candida metapsilosis]
MSNNKDSSILKGPDLRLKQSNGNSSPPQSMTDRANEDDTSKTNGSASQKQPDQNNDKRMSIKFKDINSNNGTTPLIDTSSIKTYYPTNNNSWQQNHSPLQKYSSQRSVTAPEQSPTVFPMTNKNRSDTNIRTTPRYHHHKRSSTASSNSSLTTPPGISKSSDNLRILFDKDRITPPVHARDEGNSYFNLDRTRWKGSNAAQSIITGGSGGGGGGVTNKSDRLKQSVVGDNPGLLSSPWFRDLKGGNANGSSNGNIASSSVNTSTQSLHAHKMEHSRREQKNRLVDQFLSSSKKIPPSPGSEMNGSKYFNEDLLPSSLSNSHVNLSALTPLKPSKGLRGSIGERKKSSDNLDEGKKEPVEQISKAARLQRLLDHEASADEKVERLEKQEGKLENQEKRIEEEPPRLKPHVSHKQEQSQVSPSSHQKQFANYTSTINSNISNLNASEELVNSVLNNGGFRFEYDTKHVIEDDKLVSYLINIDNVLEELEKRKHAQTHRRKHSNSFEDDEYGELVKILTTISEKVLFKTKAIIHAKTNPVKATILQLDLVSQYLNALHESMHQLRTDLATKLSQTRDNNSTIISDNLSKLNEIDSDLKKLEATTNSYKDKIIQQKQLMKNDINDKLTILEEINKSIHIHNQKRRNKRILGVNVVIAGLIVLVGIYLGFRKK